MGDVAGGVWFESMNVYELDAVHRARIPDLYDHLAFTFVSPDKTPTQMSRPSFERDILTPQPLAYPTSDTQTARGRKVSFSPSTFIESL